MPSGPPGGWPPDSASCASCGHRPVRVTVKIYNLKKLSIPKVAVLATGLASGVMVVTINPAPASALPSQTAACTGCHAGGAVGYWIPGVEQALQRLLGRTPQAPWSL